MNTSLYIARRYLFSGKKMHAINIISGISMAGVLIGSAALVIILSVFNGFETEILSLYSNFTPELKIEPRTGKTFNPNTPYFNSLRKDARVFSLTQVLEEKALIKYNNRQFIGTIKGVSDDLLKNTQLDNIIVAGSFTLKANEHQYAVIGATVQASLGTNINDPLTQLQVFSPNRNSSGNSINPADDFVIGYIDPSGIFAVQQDFDDQMITPIEFARNLLGEPNQVSSLELNFKKGTRLRAVEKELKARIGKQFTVKNRYEQNTLLYKILGSEKWAVFLILTFVLIIAIFNIIGSLTMLVIDKRKDIAILSSLGAGKGLIQGIFFSEGMLISMVGCLTGMALGLIFCLLQQYFGFIKMSGSLMVINAYPVHLKVTDFILVLFTVTGISALASGISARLSVKGLDDIKQEL
ncbi:ABC transporter permease [Mucilaginibacter sp.]